MNPQVRTGLTHAGTAIGGAIAAISFMSSHGVDVYAIWNQMNVVIASITQLVALLTPFVTAAYGIYKASTTSKLQDVIADPKAPEIAAAMPISPQANAVAEALKETK